MTILRCTCGTLLEGIGEGLIRAVDEHLLRGHPGVPPLPSPGRCDATAVGTPAGSDGDRSDVRNAHQSRRRGT